MYSVVDKLHQFMSASFVSLMAFPVCIEVLDLVSCLPELEEENRRLKAMYAELSLEHRVL